MKEIRFHGRGGQGAVTAARMLAAALMHQGEYVASFPMYGFERRGAPVVAFARFDERPISEKTQIYTPDCVVVIDPTLMNLPMLFDGLNPEGILMLNSPNPLRERPDGKVKIAGVLDATTIALEEIGRDVPNTTILGALAATTGWVKLESLITGLEDYFSGDMLKRNVHSAERGFKEVKIIQW